MRIDFSILKINPRYSFAYEARDFVIDRLKHIRQLVNRQRIRDITHFLIPEKNHFVRYLRRNRKIRNINHAHIHADISDDRRTASLEKNLRTIRKSPRIAIRIPDGDRRNHALSLRHKFAPIAYIRTLGERFYVYDARLQRHGRM